MKALITTLLLCSTLVASADHHLKTDVKDAKDDETGFVSLFDGKTLEGWKVSETPDSITVEDGAIVTEGKRAHAFYTGPVNDAKFDDFELRLKIRSFEGANGGVYIHTEYLESGWPTKGYEIQVNNTHSDWRKSGGLYGIVDVKEEDNPNKDEEWMDYRIRVVGQKITVWINGQEMATLEEDPKAERPEKMLGRFLLPEGGTIALQGHDPKSRVEYKDIRIKPLN